MTEKNIFKSSCLLQLSTSVWTGSKALDPASMEKLGSSEWIRGKKNLIDPFYIGPVKTTCMKARKFINKHALPFPLTALTLIPKESITKVEEGLKEHEIEYWNHVESFIEHYELARDEASRILGDLYQEADYPTDIRRKFKFEWRYVILDTPKKSSILPPAIYEQEKTKFRSLMEEARETAMLALREEFAGLIGHMVDRLANDDKGKPKIIRGSMVKTLNEFFDSFEERDLFEDTQLRELIEQAKAVVNEVQSPLALRCDHNLRQKLTEEMAKLKDQVDEAIQDLPRRKIRMSEPPDDTEMQEAA